jgi:predicted ATPase
LVGRKEELELLQRRWEQTKLGEGQVVLLSGEAGIGKSRLMQMAKDHVGAEPHVTITCRCSPFYQNSAFYPLIDHLQRFLKIGQTDTSEDKLAKLEQALGTRSFKSPEALSLFASLLSFALPQDSPPLNLSPQKHKEKTLESLIAWLYKEAEQQPV